MDDTMKKQIKCSTHHIHVCIKVNRNTIFMFNTRILFNLLHL